MNLLHKTRSEIPTLLLATRNQGKLIELKDLLKISKLRFITPQDLGLFLDVEEKGRTYGENAANKALVYARASGLVSLGDDSGLEVDALQGAPGLMSARYLATPGATDSDRRSYLLAQLDLHAPPWRGRFRCSVAIAWPGVGVYLTEGVCEGEIISKERGGHGFGYDPIFLIPEIGRTMAELSMEEKNRLSHRARAVKKAIPILHQIFRISI